MVIRLVLTMLQEQKDASLASATLSTLNLMLSELPLLSLQSESPQAMAAFQSWLLSVLSDNSERFSVQLKRQTFGALVMLGLATGSLSTLLSALEILHHPSMSSCVRELMVVPMLRKLDSWQVDLKLSVTSIENLRGSWTLLSNPDLLQTSAATLSNAQTLLGAITTDGEYLYIHDANHLLKVGTGFFSESEEVATVRGAIEKKVVGVDANNSGWLACVDGKLYYRSPSIEPATLVVFDTKTLRVS